MNPSRPARGRFGILPRPLRLTLAVALVLGGLLLAWRSFLATGSVCEATPPAPLACASWEAWYRWPGTALGLVAASGAALVLAQARADVPDPRPRRSRRR